MSLTRDQFIELYPHTANKELATLLGISEAAVAQRGSALGLKKTPQQRGAYWRGRKRTDENRANLRAATLGHAVSDETREKLRASHTGYKMTAERRRTHSIAALSSPNVRRGDAHPCWKGGGRPVARTNDIAYREWRQAVWERDAYICQQCGVLCNRSIRRISAHAHHLKPWKDHPELRLDVSNGVTLCRTCHMTLHGKAPRPYAMIPCVCGCGTLIPERDKAGRRRRYANHHWPHSRTTPDVVR